MSQSDTRRPPIPRSYMVVVDDTPESRLAMRYAARRAASTGGQLSLLRVLAPADFVQWGAVQQAIDAEAREAAETLLAAVSDEIRALTGLEASVAIRTGKTIDVVLAAMSDGGSVSALVLGAAAKGAPGPLVSYFAGEKAGQMPCPVIIVPGGMSESAIDNLA